MRCVDCDRIRCRSLTEIGRIEGGRSGGIQFYDHGAIGSAGGLIGSARYGETRVCCCCEVGVTVRINRKPVWTRQQQAARGLTKAHVSGVDEGGEIRIKLGHESISSARAQRRLQHVCRDRKVVGSRSAAHVNVVARIYGNSADLIGTASAQISGIENSRRSTVQLDDPDVSELRLVRYRA